MDEWYLKEPKGRRQQPQEIRGGEAEKRYHPCIFLNEYFFLFPLLHWRLTYVAGRIMSSSQDIYLLILKPMNMSPYMAIGM